MLVKNMNLKFGLETIFDNININIPDDTKTGIVGVNGSGKTTFFKVILNKQELDSGNVTFFNKKRISYLPQIITIEKLYIETTQVSEKEANKLLDKIGKLQMELDYYEPYTAEEELLKLISNMKIDDKLLNQKLNTLSGGQKSKIAFIRLLYSKPDLILLDEPTNHLDYETRDFVIDYLKNYNGGVFIISHDIDFLNRIVDKILYLDKVTHKMELINGNYSQFLRIKKEREELLTKTAEIQERERQKLVEIIERYRHGNEKKAKIAKDRMKKLEKLEENMVVIEKKQKKTNLKITQERESTKHPLIITDLCFKYNKSDKRNLIYKLNFDIKRGEKFLIVGENGVGKSTLLKLIVGELTPDSGEIRFGDKTDIGYYAQEHDHLDLEKNIFESLDEFDLTDNEKIGYLGRFLFYGDDRYKKVKVLSPGERSRLALLILSLKKANFLILDEPTNHFDPDTQKIIAKNFKDFPGTLIIVSHNEEFVNDLGIERILVLPEGNIHYYDKNIVKKYHELYDLSMKKKTS